MNTLDVGACRPLGVGAGSLALLAALPAEERARTIAGNAERYGRYGALTGSRVAAAVRQSHRDGYAFNRAFIIPEVGAVGVPFEEADGRLAGAISVATVLTRLRPRRRAAIRDAIAAAVTRAGFVVRAAGAGGRADAAD